MLWAGGGEGVSQQWKHHNRLVNPLHLSCHWTRQILKCRRRNRRSLTILYNPPRRLLTYWPKVLSIISSWETTQLRTCQDCCNYSFASLVGEGVVLCFYTDSNSSLTHRSVFPGIWVLFTDDILMWSIIISLIENEYQCFLFPKEKTTHLYTVPTKIAWIKQQ